VWAIDLGQAVVVAERNTETAGSVQVVQADLHRPPFAAESFDFIYSIGVLHRRAASQTSHSLCDDSSPSRARFSVANEHTEKGTPHVDSTHPPSGVQRRIHPGRATQGERSRSSGPTSSAAVNACPRDFIEGVNIARRSGVNVQRRLTVKHRCDSPREQKKSCARDALNERARLIRSGSIPRLAVSTFTMTGQNAPMIGELVDTGARAGIPQAGGMVQASGDDPLAVRCAH